MPIVLVGNSMAVIVVYIAVSGFVSQALQYWTLFMITLTGLRGLVWKYHSVCPYNPDNLVFRAGLVFTLSTLGGIMWGLAGVRFFNTSFPLDNILLVMVVAAITSGALVSMSGFLSLYFVFAICSLSPISIFLMLQEEQQFFVMGGSFLLYLLINLAMSINIERAITQTFRLQNENAALIEELREQKNIAEQANLDKSKFLAAISHDLRQPMHAIGLFISGLQPYVLPAGEKVLERAHQSVIALRSMFNSLLDLTKLDAGTIGAELVPLNLAPFLERIVEGFAGAAHEKGLKLSLQNLDAVVLTDALMLERVLRNLLGNAIQYSHKGTVSLCCTPGKDIVTIAVHDEGCGIPHAERKNIFSEYHQLNNGERNRSKGLGLGLAIVRRICVNLSLPLRLESQLEQGSVFSVDVPLAEEGAPNFLELRTPMLDLSQQSVVVIDDEQTILDATRQLLDLWGCESVLADSIDSAIKQIEERSIIPSVLIVDYRLHNETGLDAIRRIRSKIGTDTPSIILTGDTGPDLTDNKNSKKFIILHKPVAPAELRTAIHQLTLIKRESNE